MKIFATVRNMKVKLCLAVGWAVARNTSEKIVFNLNSSNLDMRVMNKACFCPNKLIDKVINKLAAGLVVFRSGLTTEKVSNKTSKSG